MTAILTTALTNLTTLARSAGVLVAFIYATIILQTFNVFDLIVRTGSSWSPAARPGGATWHRRHA